MEFQGGKGAIGSLAAIRMLEISGECFQGSFEIGCDAFGDRKSVV